MDEINMFNEGGSHSQNPLGGIPMGVNPTTGQQQTVEEGETMANIKGEDYIFSKNFNVSKKDIEEFGLPKNLSGKNMADASSIIKELFEDREDGISKNTKYKFLERLSEVQEMKKAIQQEEYLKNMETLMKSASIDPEEGMGEEMPPMPEELAGMEGTEMFESGGFLGTAGLSGGEATGAGISNALGAATGLYSLFDQASGNSSTKSGVAALTGATTGAGVGTMIFPGVGTAIGAGVGAITGIIGSSNAKKKEAIAAGKSADAYNSQFNDIQQFENGGFMNNNIRVPQSRYAQTMSSIETAGFNPVARNRKTMSPLTRPLTKGFSANNPMFGMASINPSGYDINGKTTAGGLIDSNRNAMNTSPITNRFQGTPQPENSRFKNFTDNVAGAVKGVSGNDMLRLSPVATTLSQLNSMKKPTYGNPRLDTTVPERRYLDTESMVRGVNEASNSAFGAINQTGMSEGARRNAIIAANLQRSKGIGEAMFRTSEYNQGVDNRADDIVRQTNSQNLTKLLQADENFARDTGAYNTERSKMIGSLGKSLGDIGLEGRNADVLGKMYGYSTKGDYLEAMQVVDNSPELQNKIKEEIEKHRRLNSKKTKNE